MKILVAFDASPSAEAALERAMALFAGSELEVVLLGALVPPMTTSDLAEQAHEVARAEAEAALQRAGEAVRAAGLAVRVLLVEGEPREVLEKVAREEAPSVVVVGARGRSRIGRLLLGSVSSYAVDHLACPVLVVR
jgi:nucleotide-binding universal stress UspA family protein